MVEENSLLVPDYGQLNQNIQKRDQGFYFLKAHEELPIPHLAYEQLLQSAIRYQQNRSSGLEGLKVWPRGPWASSRWQEIAEATKWLPKRKTMPLSPFSVCLGK